MKKYCFHSPESSYTNVELNCNAACASTQKNPGFQPQFRLNHSLFRPTQFSLTTEYQEFLIYQWRSVAKTQIIGQQIRRAVYKHCQSSGYWCYDRNINTDRCVSDMCAAVRVALTEIWQRLTRGSESQVLNGGLKEGLEIWGRFSAFRISTDYTLILA